MTDKSCIGPRIEGRGYNMTLASGRAVYPLDMRPEDIHIEDIAASLSRICRFNGHLRHDVEHYSVAQHSVHVSHLVDPFFAREALLHDATEAYVGDMVRPLKVDLADYNEIERRVWIAVAERFNLPVNMSPRIKHADNVALATEFRDIIVEDREADTGKLETPCNEKIKPLNAFAARDLFMDRAIDLGF